jgi:hypothetical protein
VGKIAKTKEKDEKPKSHITGKYDKDFKPAKRDEDTVYECEYLEDEDGKSAWALVIRPKKEEKSL